MHRNFILFEILPLSREGKEPFFRKREGRRKEGRKEGQREGRKEGGSKEKRQEKKVLT